MGKDRLKVWARQMAYSLGFMGVLHRVRNRDTLTVFMFHRVLPPDSLAYRRAEKEFTFSVAGFERTLDFIDRHYNVVRHHDIKAAVDGHARLPKRAALITFDDGWRDTLLHAREPLARRGMSAVLFLATEVPQLRADRWWQDQVVEACSDEEKWHRLKDAMPVESIAQSARREPTAQAVTVALSRLPDEARHQLLDGISSKEAMPRQMLTEKDLSQLAPVIALAGHGHTHAPLRNHPDAKRELTLSHEQLQQWGGDKWSMSFPHGSYDTHSLELARRAGFRVCFTSDAVLMRTTSPDGLSNRIGRIHLPENQWTCENGQISHAKLATYLFLREHAS